MQTMLPLLMFLVGTGTILAAYALIAWLPGRLAQRRIEARVAGLTLPPSDIDDKPESASIVKRQLIGFLPILDRLAAKMRWGSRLSDLIHQSGSQVGVSTIVVISILLAVVVGGLAAVLSRMPWAMLPGALAGVSVPILVLKRKRTRRMARFEEQFPEALDLLSRAIRAGHAFTTAMSMVADEAPDPIGPEFKKTFEEQNFGIALKDALTNLGDRMPLIDVRFFVTAVLIQDSPPGPGLHRARPHDRVRADGPAGGACDRAVVHQSRAHGGAVRGAHGALDDPGHHHHAGHGLRLDSTGRQDRGVRW